MGGDDVDAETFVTLDRIVGFDGRDHVPDVCDHCGEIDFRLDRRDAEAPGIAHGPGGVARRQERL